MKNKMLKYCFYAVATLLTLAAGVGAFVIAPIEPPARSDTILGVTFSIHAAEALGFQWKDVYNATVNELQPRLIRIPVYWNIVETQRDLMNWEPYDYQMDKLGGRKTKVILAIGNKLPRWPECHMPEWTNGLSEEEVKEELKEMMTMTVKRYADRSHLYGWQIQNEALFPFGECPDWVDDRDFLKDLVETVRRIDNDHKITTSDSGELSTWLRTASLPIDNLSVSLYRAVYDPKHDYFFWPVNPYFYRLHAAAVYPLVSEISISELQMEPWGPKPVQDLTTVQAYRSFPPYHFEERIDFARRTGAKEILAWGVEWWYYMKEKRREPLYWNEALKHFTPPYDDVVQEETSGL